MNPAAFGHAELFQFLQFCVSAGLLAYAVKIEHRFTEVETYVKVLMQEHHKKSGKENSHG